MREAQEASGIRADFLLDTFLCPRKEKYFVRGYETHIKTNRRVSDTNNPLTSQLLIPIITQKTKTNLSSNQPEFSSYPVPRVRFSVRPVLFIEMNQR
jgi:hypothetical protein